MPDLSAKWLVETDWLAERLNSPGLVVMDASLGVNAEGKTAEDSYREAHIPGALFFDIDDLSDTASTLPNMLPPPEKFASRMRKLGVGDGMKVVVYDTKGIYSAPRAWWMFRVMGHDDVAVLNGGLPKWKAEGRATESGQPGPRSERHFSARKNSALVRDLSDVSRIVSDQGSAQLVDARSKARFEGREGEPRPVPRLGHMPGAHNVPFQALVNADGTLKPSAELRAAFEAAGVNPMKPVVTTCGSGITACIDALALAVVGNEHAAVYDGSWFEWSHAPSVAVVSGDKGDAA
jgi:thiosulfate/3-mercaptopyruvate sulfurtransferase